MLVVPETWAGYQEAVTTCKEQGYGGIGFVFTPADDLCGVDLDGCLDPETGEIEAWAQEVIGELDSYTKISPSGTGVHILVRGELPQDRNRKERFEAYDRGRYFTMTGRHLEGTPQNIEKRQEELQGVTRRVFGEPSTNGHGEAVTTPERTNNGFSDEEVIEKARSESNGKFDRLWRGNMSDYPLKANGKPDHSSADDGFVHKLYSYTQDEEQIKRAHAMSGLHRPEKSGKRADYLQRSIDRARENVTWFYEWPKTVKLADGTERNSVYSNFEEVKEFVELPQAPTFPVDALPESCKRFVREAAISIGCASDLVAVPLLGLLSSAIGNSRQVQLKRGWKESAAIFAVVVAEPGDKKTPAQKAALAPLWQAQKRLKKEYQEEYEVYEEELRHWEAERKVAAKEGEPAPPNPKSRC